MRPKECFHFPLLLYQLHQTKHGVKMVLSEIIAGHRARVVGVDGGTRLIGTLNQYGLYPGEQIRVLRIAPFGGPVLIEINQREVALGRKVAGKVRVELVEELN